MHISNISSIITIFFVPLYIFGRLINSVFVIIILLYLSFTYNIYIFIDNDIPLFQTIMLICYICLIFVWILSLFNVSRDEYYVSFILPSTKQLSASYDHKINTQKTQQIMDYYYSVLSGYVAKKCCIILFGKDITNIIMGYCAIGDISLDNDEKNQEV